MVGGVCFVVMSGLVVGKGVVMVGLGVGCIVVVGGILVVVMRLLCGCICYYI